MAHTILLADDSITIRKVVELSFHDTDIRVESVSSGQEAVDRLPEMKPDLVLADVFMPGPTGYDLCRMIKDSENPVPVLLLRGAFEPFDDNRAEACGSDGHLVKPFEARALVEMVTALLQRAEDPVDQISAALEESERETLEAEALLDDLADEAAFSTGPAVELDVADIPAEEIPAVEEPSGDSGEAALRQALANASEEIIREIAWEVVPELAEALIRERIRELEREKSET
ncbi:MAG: response regulator [Acidobacteria bacterium]|uniref:Response regulator n=1 Tax=Candidatus Polarisedimenticola svalbardensis TaxID=2886004 RepID=A0A8J6XX60_9BACT|nr:response regulator [Candidatus Polarisedimenticola svalbardensis]